MDGGDALGAVGRAVDVRHAHAAEAERRDVRAASGRACRLVHGNVLLCGDRPALCPKMAGAHRAISRGNAGRAVRGGEQWISDLTTSRVPPRSPAAGSFRPAAIEQRGSRRPALSEPLRDSRRARRAPAQPHDAQRRRRPRPAGAAASASARRSPMIGGGRSRGRRIPSTVPRGRLRLGAGAVDRPRPARRCATVPGAAFRQSGWRSSPIGLVDIVAAATTPASAGRSI